MKSANTPKTTENALKIKWRIPVVMVSLKRFSERVVSKRATTTQHRDTFARRTYLSIGPIRDEILPL
ncbi:hypothetical protein NQ318_017124 [Aromia moschata]|uniref:Uncharacterized protein n=1 Tax=Aromia moschata TaxID=1265417 RepID=A0AAV8X8Q2_9CUCU|nr:hypothetical protein NQ318_017124 [Aromia moschata]